MSLAVLRDLREARAAAGPEALAAFETDVLAGFVLARPAAGLCSPSSVSTPALRKAFTSARTRLSLTRARTRSSRAECETLSKEPPPFYGLR